MGWLEVARGVHLKGKVNLVPSFPSYFLSPSCELGSSVSPYTPVRSTTSPKTKANGTDVNLGTGNPNQPFFVS